MQSLSLASLPASPPQILCIGAHCDDIEIGGGGTVLSLQRWYPACRIHWFVLTSDAVRRAEAMRGFRAFVGSKCRGELRIGNLRDGLLPASYVAVKQQFEELKRAVEPDLIITHHGLDRHQDHALVSEVTWQTFRDHLILEYEIPKFDGDLSTPGLYVPLAATVARRKVKSIVETFTSQRTKPWFSAENLLAVMRLRGLECRSAEGHAEGFHLRKAVLDGGAFQPVRRRAGPHRNGGPQ